MQAWTWIGYCRDVGPCMHSDQHGAVILMTTGRASHRHSQIVPVVFGRSQHLASQRVPPTSHVPAVSTSQALPRIPGILPVGYPIDDPGKAGTVLGRERLFPEWVGSPRKHKCTANAQGVVHLLASGCIKQSSALNPPISIGKVGRVRLDVAWQYGRHGPCQATSSAASPIRRGIGSCGSSALRDTGPQVLRQGTKCVWGTLLFTLLCKLYMGHKGILELAQSVQYMQGYLKPECMHCRSFSSFASASKTPRVRQYVQSLRGAASMYIYMQ